VYIADGYGNHRIVVFDRKGQYLRQWGSSGTGPGQFYPTGGGHPHCVVLGNDGLVYACDRQANRIQVFDRLGALRRIIVVVPPGTSESGGVRVERSVSDIAFSPDAEQRYIFVAYYGCGCDAPEGGRVYVLDRQTGATLARIGDPGPAAGQFLSAHSIGVDSKGRVYVGESPMGQRTQRFAPAGN
jgi:streptogramin lyase